MADSSKEPSRASVLGVCGGIGSGKSQACKILVSELGCVAHIDADSLAHVVYKPGSRAIEEIADLFGSKVLQDNGEIDRKELGGIVFNDANAMSKLERIVWPYVKKEVDRLIAESQSSTESTKVPVIVLEAAMLLDAGWEDLLDGLWVVTAAKETAMSRLMENRGLSMEDATARMEAQESRRGIQNLAQEMAHGPVTCCIENNGTLEDLKNALENAITDPTCWKNDAVFPKSYTQLS